MNPRRTDHRWRSIGPGLAKGTEFDITVTR